MTGQPPSGPLKYKVSTPEEAPAPKRVHLPPPKKLRLSHREALFRVVIVLVILVSIAVAYWSFSSGCCRFNSSRARWSPKSRKCPSRLDQAERRWTPEQINCENATSRPAATTFDDFRIPEFRFSRTVGCC